MKENIEKLTLLIFPFLLAISVCYNNGYWSLYAINVYDYYQVTDILKDIAIPSFRFMSIALLPFTVAIAIAISFLQNTNKNDLSNKKEADSSSEAEESNKQSSIKKPKSFKENAKELILIMLGMLIFLLLASGAIFVSILLSSYSDDIDLAITYLKSFETLPIEALCICIIAPLISSFILVAANKNKPGEENDNISKLTTFLSCILFTLLLAYNAGRFDAWKVALGYDFYFKFDKNKNPQKYLGKLDKYYFFAHDDRMFMYKPKFKFRLDTISYSPQISIIHEDELKNLRMVHYQTGKLLRPLWLYGKFTLMYPDSVYNKKAVISDK